MRWKTTGLGFLSPKAPRSRDRDSMSLTMLGMRLKEKAPRYRSMSLRAQLPGPLEAALTRSLQARGQLAGLAAGRAAVMWYFAPWDFF